MEEENKLKLLQAIYSFIQRFRPYLTEAEFLQANLNNDEVELLSDNFELIKGVPHTRCRYSFSLSKLKLFIEIGNHSIRSFGFRFDEAVEYFHDIHVDELLDLTEEDKSTFFEAYALALGRLDLENAREIYVENGGGNIEDFHTLQKSKFKLFKERIIQLYRSDNEKFLKAFIAIEIQDNDEDMLDIAYLNYMNNNKPLLNQELFKGEK